MFTNFTIHKTSINNGNIVAYTFDTQLDDQDQYHLYWNYNTNSVTFRVKAQLAHNNDWFAIGFSHDGGIGGADICIIWADAESNLKLQELHVDSEGLAVVDPTNDCLRLNASLESNELSFAFRRAFNTCDPYDYIIEDGTTNMVYATGSATKNHTIDMNDSKHGTRPIRLMDIPDPWANGSKPFVYPEEVGVAVGGQSGPQYLLLETHYHNLAYKPDILDSSGLRIYVINKPRKYDAGLVKIGMNSFGKYVDLPPNRPVVDLSVYVTPECSSVALPVNGITIFAQEFHTHQKRTRVWTQHVRNGTELAEFNRDNHCNYQFLDIWLLKQRVTVMPGDVLVHTCSYDTTKNPVAPDIMCSTFFHYYPATNLKWVVNELGPYIRYLGQHLDYTEQQLNDNRPPFEEICDKLSGESYPV
ncbi:unnamed protein product [Oppiella nova]|uniref:DOMON domain-containing protein n=1 Tax=Oppiella nova TaxID=334625 RepID=A0A7R9LTK9_9ACAR|nr:unnamed protein product [Oppiella nova]CAG2166822.1 unnamed protein product [Oppiella nova]